jgi:tetratricopeptide (TPR) repeat protein
MLNAFKRSISTMQSIQKAAATLPRSTWHISVTISRALGIAWLTLIKMMVRTGWVLSRLIKLWILPIIAGLVIWASVLELRSHTVEIHGFEVSSEMTAAGYTGSTVQRLFSNQLQKVQKDAQSFRLAEGSRLVHAVAESDIDIKVPQTEISLRSLIRYIRDLLGIPVTKISGSCITQSGALIISIWMTGHQSFITAYTWPTFEETGPLENALLKSAEDVFLQIEPFTVATYNYNHARRHSAMMAIGKCLGNEKAEDDHQALALWGRILADSKQYPLAIAKCDESLRLRPAYIYAALHKANALDDWGKKDQALEAYATIIAADPKAINGYIDRGICLSTRRQYASATQDFEKALKLDPHSQIAKERLILIKLELGDVGTARKMADELMQLDPKSYRWSQLVGNIWKRNEHYAEAIESFSKALGLARNSSEKADAAFERAFCYNLMGESEKSIEDYEVSVKEDPYQGAAWFNLGVVLTKRDGITSEVLRCYESAFKLLPDDDETLFFRGASYKALGRLSEARMDFQAIASNTASQPFYRQKAIDALQQLINQGQTRKYSKRSDAGY